MANQQMLSRRLASAVMVMIVPILVACHVQFVSPYSADLQKKATDMLADVVAWESHMRGVAGTAAADPRSPDVQAKFAAWRGDIEAMGAIEVSIDPQSTACNKFLQTISTGVQNELKTLPAAAGIAGSEAKPVSRCETLPDILALMAAQVAEIPTTSAKDSTASHSMLVFLDQQCKLPWLSNQYFAALQEGRATAGAASPARPVPVGAKASAPTAQQQSQVVDRCRSLFIAEPDAAHGDLVSTLVRQLNSIIYREGRQAPTAAK